MDKTAIQKLCDQQTIESSKFISPDSIVIEDWPRHKCKYGCPGYNSNYCCPPHSPTAEQTRKIVAGYTAGLLVHFTKGMPVTKTIVKIEKELFLMNYHKAIGFGAGPCSLCKECPEKGCTFPHKARPSMEACGIDVYATARNNGFPINVVKTKEDEVNFYGLVLIE